MEKGLIVPLDDVYRLVGVLTTIEFEPIDPDAEEGEDDEDDEELNPAYRFLHDRVQQAAYSLIPEAEREGTHLAIARALDRADAEDRDLFGVANQYARSYQLIRDPGEREAVARLFHAAGERARLATAHEPAIRFFESAAKLLDDPWGAQYELGWSTSFQRAASEYLGGDTDLAERMTDELLGRSREKLEKLQIYNLKVEIRAARSDFKDAVDVCREAVALTGVSIPQDPGVPAMLYEVFKTQFIIRKTPPLEIADLPAATDPEMILTLKLLNTIAAAAFFVNANLGSIVLMKMTQTSYLHGNAPDSAFAWGCYCMVVGPILGNFEKALLYNESAKRIAAEYPDPGQMAKWPSSIAGLVQHWSHDPRSAIPMLLDAFAAGLEAGDPLHAHYCAVQLMNLRIMLGDNLDEVGAWARTYIDHAVRYQIGESMQSLEADLMLVRVLRGDTGDVLFGESEAEEAAWRARLEGFQMKLPAHAWLTYKGLALLFMGQAKEARPFLVDAFGYDSAVSANPQYSQHHWLLCQADLAAWDALDAAERKEARKRIRKAKKRIDTWAKTSPLGFTHKKLYVEAELARIDGDMGTATRLIDQAIDDAAENRYPHNEG
jgi:predicted ATPase